MTTVSLIPYLLTIIFLLLLSGFFSGSETSLFSLNKIERRRIADEHPLVGRTVEDLLERPRRTLITILIGNMVVNTLVTVIVTHLALRLFGEKGVGITIGFFTIVLLMFGEVMPKIFAIRNNITIATLSAVSLNIFAKVIFPVRFVIRKLSDWILSFLSKGTRKTDTMSEDELKALVRIGEEEGVLRKEEVHMITRLIDLGKRPVKQIMTPKTEFVAFDIQKGSEALTAVIKKYHFSHIPIYEGNLDHFLGVISSQAFMLNPGTDLNKFLQTPEYIPETKRIDELLLEFKLKKRKFAICVDEYGGVSGLVTFEDVLEEVFGEFHDEYAQVEALVKEIRNGEYLVQTKITLHELYEKLGIHLKSEFSETLNGWILEKLGRIPLYNESFFFGSYQFQIMEVFKNKIQKVLIRKKHD